MGELKFPIAFFAPYYTIYYVSKYSIYIYSCRSFLFINNIIWLHNYSTIITEYLYIIRIVYNFVYNL